METQGKYTGLQLSQATETLDCTHAVMTALETNPTLVLPWAPDSPQCIEAKTLHEHQKYHQLLDEIKQHAVSHQFKIEKMGLPKTGEILLSDHPTSTSWSETDYKTHQNIGSLVAQWGKTLHSTLEKYNTLAASMKPLKPKMTWVNVTSLDFISDIVILHGHEDICDKPWAQPLIHNAM